MESGLIRDFRQGHQSTGAGRGGLDAADLGQRVAGFDQDVTVRGEFREIRSDHVGGGRAGHRSGTHGARRHAGRPPEEDHEQRDGAPSTDVRHLARFPRLIRRTVGAFLAERPFHALTLPPALISRYITSTKRIVR